MAGANRRWSPRRPASHKRSLSETARTVKLIDLGVARLIDDTGDVRRLKPC